MKNKKIFNALLTLCAALILMGGFSVTAYAQTPEGQDDATDDSGVVYEEPEKEEPLTPDGNATLVDDFGGNKQLITVTTKNGNYFYILIDRDDEGENTVHCLTKSAVPAWAVSVPTTRTPFLSWKANLQSWKPCRKP